MWPNAALSDIIREWKGTVVEKMMNNYRWVHESGGLDKYWNLDDIADAIEKGKSKNVRKMLRAMYDTDWEDEIRRQSQKIHEQYGPELGDLVLLHNLVYFV